MKILRADIAEMVTRLIDKSLAIPDENATRYRVLESVRQYSHEISVDKAEIDAARLLHLRYFLGLANNVDHKIRGPHQIEWLDRFEKEQDNFRTAMAWGMDQPELLADTMELAWELLNFWLLRARLEEGTDWISGLLQRVPADDIDSQILGLVGLACCCRHLNDGRDIDLLEDALELARSSGSERMRCRALFGLGYSYLYRDPGDPRAFEYLTEALQMQRDEGDTFAEADCLLCLGDAALYMGNLEAANEYFLLGKDLRSRGADKRGVSSANGRLGRVQELMGDLPAAARLHANAILGLAETGDLYSLAEGFAGGCCALWLANRKGEAAQILGYGDSLCSQLGTKRNPADQRFHERWMERLRGELGVTAFDSAYEVGRSLSLDVALQLATIA